MQIEDLNQPSTMPIHVRSLIFSRKSCDVLMRGSSFIKYCLPYKKEVKTQQKVVCFCILKVQDVHASLLKALK